MRKDAVKSGFTDAEKQIMKAHAAYGAQLKDGIEHGRPVDVKFNLRFGFRANRLQGQSLMRVI